MNIVSPRFRVTIFTILFFYVDHLSKIWAELLLSLGDIAILGSFFRLSLHHNSNLALSIPFPLFGQLALSLILILFLMYYFGKKHPPKTGGEVLAVALIFGGAIGNMYDRARFGAVVDFIAIGNFPIFNLADTFLFLGVGVLFLKEFFGKKNSGV